MPLAQRASLRLLLSGSDGEDQSIAGLYAAGTDMASIMGGHSPTGGPGGGLRLNRRAAYRRGQWLGMTALARWA